MTKSHARLVDIELDPDTIGRERPDIEHSRIAAIHDLKVESQFQPNSTIKGPYNLSLTLQDNKLIMVVLDQDHNPVMSATLSLSALRPTIRDYRIICDAYYESIKSAPPSRIEAIDMGRRGLHNDGAELLREQLNGQIELGDDTARHLFTLICSLSIRG